MFLGCIKQNPRVTVNLSSVRSSVEAVWVLSRDKLTGGRASRSASCRDISCCGVEAWVPRSTGSAKRNTRTRAGMWVGGPGRAAAAVHATCYRVGMGGRSALELCRDAMGGA